jgi:hypothetical protein
MGREWTFLGASQLASARGPSGELSAGALVMRPSAALQRLQA